MSSDSWSMTGLVCFADKICFWSSFSLLCRVMAASLVIVYSLVYRFLIANSDSSKFPLAYISSCCCTFFNWRKVECFLLCFTEFMFITEEILSGVHMCWFQLCFSFPCSRPKQPGSPVFSVCVCVCKYLREIVFRTASFQPRFSFSSYQNSSACSCR